MVCDRVALLELLPEGEAARAAAGESEAGLWDGTGESERAVEIDAIDAHNDDEGTEEGGGSRSRSRKKEREVSTPLCLFEFVCSAKSSPNE